MLLGVGGSDGLFAKLSVTLVTHGLWPARLCCPWNFPGKNTGVDCRFQLCKLNLSELHFPHL